MTGTYEKLVATVTEPKDNEYLDFMARRLVESAAHCILGYLLLQDANKDDSFLKSADVYINYGESEIHKNQDFISKFKLENLSSYRQEQNYTLDATV
jgi:hypothetical protein